MPKICIFGAGAIGGLIGCNLCSANENEVSVIARNQTLTSIRTQGWKLQTNSGISTFRVAATDNPEDLGVQDFVVISVKAHALIHIIDKITPLIGPDTQIITAMNGIPWWFDEGLQALNGKRLSVLDLEGLIRKAIPNDQVIGCVVHPSAHTLDDKPGHVFHNGGDHLIFGTPTPANEHVLSEAASLFEGTGLRVTVTTKIRQEIWYKLWGNMTLNPLSAITGATVDRILNDEFLSVFCVKVMNEAKFIGEKLGLYISWTPEERNKLTAGLGAVKTSMLQDAERGRPIELDAILASVVELARLLRVETPSMNDLFGMTRLFARTHGLYPE